MADLGEVELVENLAALSAQPRGCVHLDESIREAEFVVPRSDELHALVREVRARWFTAARRSTDYAAWQRVNAPGPMARAYASFVSELVGDVDAVGRALVRWDGHGVVPVRSSLPGRWQPVPDEAVDHDGYYAWKLLLGQQLESLIVGERHAQTDSDAREAS